MAEKDDWKKQLPYIGEYELGIHKTPVKKLADILASCTIRQLKSFFYSYNVTNKDIPSKKAELVSAAVKLITENCAQFLMCAGGINFDFYKQYLNCRNTETGVCNADLYVPDPKDYEDESEIFMYIMKSGLVKIFLQKGLLFKFDVRNGDELFVIPDEVYDEVTTHIKKDGTHPFGSMYACKEFADTLLSLYGVLTVRDFKILWETAFPEQKMTREEIIEFMKFSSRDNDVYNFHENKNILSHILLDEEQAQEILDDRKLHTLYVPSKENLLNWFEDSKNPDTDDAFNSQGKFEFEYKNPCYIQMKGFLEKARKHDEDSDEILTDIMFYIKDGFRMNQVIEILNEDYELTQTMSAKEAEKFFKIYQELNNSTHLWVNYGSSPNDLSSQKTHDLRFFSSPVPVMQTPPNVSPFPKVGRNDPCPCGSGKKFKQCHGRK